MSVIAHDGKVVVAGGKSLSFDNLISMANETTGQSDITLTDAVQSLIDGFGGGGGVEMHSGVYTPADTSAQSFIPHGFETYPDLVVVITESPNMYSNTLSGYAYRITGIKSSNFYGEYIFIRYSSSYQTSMGIANSTRTNGFFSNSYLTTTHITDGTYRFNSTVHWYAFMFNSVL